MDPDRYRQGEAQTIRGVLATYEREGFTTQFGVADGGQVICYTCRQEFAPEEADVATIHRLEGASDPDDMVAVIPLTCPRCARRGTLLVRYGPESTIDEAAVLSGLPDADRPPQS